MADHVEYLEPAVPVNYGMLGMDGANSAMRPVTRQVAFDGAWDDERRRKVGDLFDSMAPEWHTRVSVADRHIPLFDALDRGNVPKGGLVLELGSGIGDSTPHLEERVGPTVAVDLAMEMLARAGDGSPRVKADAGRLPVGDGVASVVVLVNALLFPAEMDRVLAPDGVIVWVNTSGEHTPIHLPAHDVVAALPGDWTAIASRADRGTWCVARRS